jgi:hypothetical protein
VETSKISYIDLISANRRSRFAQTIANVFRFAVRPNPGGRKC